MADFLNRDEALLLVVDIQERLAPAIHKDLYPRTMRNTQIMIETAGELGLPILLTEQYPKGLGATVPELLTSLKGKKYQKFEKVSFSCARDEACMQAVAAPNRQQMVVVGMETHVCVYQTSVDLIRAGYSVFVLDDAVSSRFLHNVRERAVGASGCWLYRLQHRNCGLPAAQGRRHARVQETGVAHTMRARFLSQHGLSERAPSAST